MMNSLDRRRPLPLVVSRVNVLLLLEYHYGTGTCIYAAYVNFGWERADQ